MKRERLRLVPRFEPEPEPEPKRIQAPGHGFAITSLVVIVTRTGERRELDHLAWPKYGIEEPLA